MSMRGALAPIADIVADVYDLDLRAFRQVLAAQITPTLAKPTRTLAVLPNLVIPPQIDQMSIINARSL